MNIAWSSFTPWSALAGGALIGLAAALLALLNGRIAGISGIVGGLMGANAQDRLWRVAFLLGLVAAPFAWRVFGALPAAVIEADTPQLIIAGLLVGLGTRYAGGCTSGHGVCGLARLSPRSLAATLSFMAAGFLMVFVLRHALGA
jgi:uncharacterized protein